MTLPPEVTLLGVVFADLRQVTANERPRTVFGGKSVCLIITVSSSVGNQEVGRRKFGDGHRSDVSLTIHEHIIAVWGGLVKYKMGKMGSIFQKQHPSGTPGCAKMNTPSPEGEGASFMKNPKLLLALEPPP